MALNDSSVVYPNTAHFFTGVTGTVTAPTLANLAAYVADTTTTITGFSEVGHTTLDQIMAWGADGGDSEVKGSLQNKSLRQIITSEAIDYFTINAMQVRDNQVMSWYYGGGDATGVNTFATPDSPTIPQVGFLAVIFDDLGPLGLFCKKLSIKRDSEIQMPADDFVSMPLRFTPLKATGFPKMRWIGAGLGVAA